MEKKKSAKVNKGKVERVQPVSKNVITASGTIRKQYPPSVGYHGTDKEKNLNVEE